MQLYHHLKKSEIGELNEKLREKDEELENIKKLYDENVKSTEQKIKTLESEIKKLKAKGDQSLSYTEAKKGIKKLVVESRKNVVLGHTIGGTFYPICHGYLDEHGCSVYTKIKSDRILSGIQCNHKKHIGFYKQDERPIPIHLREYV